MPQAVEELPEEAEDQGETEDLDATALQEAMREQEEGLLTRLQVLDRTSP